MCCTSESRRQEFLQAEICCVRRNELCLLPVACPSFAREVCSWFGTVVLELYHGLGLRLWDGRACHVAVTFGVAQGSECDFWQGLAGVLCRWPAGPKISQERKEKHKDKKDKDKKDKVWMHCNPVRMLHTLSTQGWSLSS